VEPVFLGDVFMQSGYTNWQLHTALKPPLRVAQPNKKLGVYSIPVNAVRSTLGR
jgi:hypothetical protein